MEFNSLTDIFCSWAFLDMILYCLATGWWRDANNPAPVITLMCIWQWRIMRVYNIKTSHRRLDRSFLVWWCLFEASPACALSPSSDFPGSPGFQDLGNLMEFEHCNFVSRVQSLVLLRMGAQCVQYRYKTSTNANQVRSCSHTLCIVTGDTALQSASDFADDMVAWLFSAAYGSANREIKCWTLDIDPKTELLLRVFWDTKSFLTFLPRDLPACFWLLLMLAGSSALAVLATFAGLSGRIWHGSEYWQYWDIWKDMKRWTILSSIR